MLLRLLTASILLVALAGCGRRSSEKRHSASSAQQDQSAQAPTAAEPSTSDYILVDGRDILRLGRAEGGKGFLVNVWASWCGPCKREFPMLMALRQSYRAAGIHLIFVSVDEEATRGDAVRFAADQGLLDTILVARAPLDALKAVLNPRWPGMLPATFLYDSQGRLRYYFGGPVYESELSPIALGLARGEPIQGEAVFGLAPGMDARGAPEAAP